MTHLESNMALLLYGIEVSHNTTKVLMSEITSQSNLVNQFKISNEILENEIL